MRAKAKAELASLKTSSGSANKVNELPRLETVCPINNFQKSALLVSHNGYVCEAHSGENRVTERMNTVSFTSANALTVPEERNTDFTSLASLTFRGQSSAGGYYCSVANSTL